MSTSSLDRLKALTSKLEERIAQEKGLSSSVPKNEPEIPKESPALDDKHRETKMMPAVAAPVKSENADKIREENIERVKFLYDDLKIFEKSPDFGKIFVYKAMNLSGIGLKEEDFGVIRKGKYIQVIAITYEPDATGKKKAKNISLGYFGKAETIDPNLKNKIIEFILRWRYEKAFQNVAHYKDLLSKLERPKTLF